MKSWGTRMRGRLPWRVVVGTLLALFLAGAAIAGYLIGSPPAVDVGAARLAAAAQGREQGAEKGAKEGYAQGYRSARKRPHDAAYSAAYREAYAGEFESAGLDPPERIRVPDRR